MNNTGMIRNYRNGLSGLRAIMYLPCNEHSIDGVYASLDKLHLDAEELFPIVIKEDGSKVLATKTHLIDGVLLTTASCVEDIPGKLFEDAAAHRVDYAEGFVTSEFALEQLYSTPEFRFDGRALYDGNGNYIDPREITGMLADKGSVVLEGYGRTIELDFLPVDNNALARYVWLRPKETPGECYEDPERTIHFVRENRLTNFSEATLSNEFKGAKVKRENVTRRVEANARLLQMKLNGNGDLVLAGDLLQTGSSAEEQGLEVLKDFDFQYLVNMRLKNGKQ